VLGDADFDQGPDYIATFYSVHELVSKIVQALMVCSCYCPQEDVGQTHIFSVVTGNAASFMRIAFDDARSSDNAGVCIHAPCGGFFLKACLPPHAARE
jgi:hypothetical protein